MKMFKLYNDKPRGFSTIALCLFLKLYGLFISIDQNIRNVLQSNRVIHMKTCLITLALETGNTLLCG